MNYFTATISTSLTEKLKEKGMPIDCIENFAGTGEDIDIAPSYGKVLDWLMFEKGLVLHVWAGGDENDKGNLVEIFKGIKTMTGKGNFCEAAEKAIEKALTLI